MNSLRIACFGVPFRPGRQGNFRNDENRHNPASKTATTAKAYLPQCGPGASPGPGLDGDARMWWDRHAGAVGYALIATGVLLSLWLL